jgi:hypothetical protein
MTPEQQRIAIAEACGVRIVESADGWCDIERNGILERKGAYKSVLIKGLPDYLNDLNAMHEAEKVLTREQLVDYCAFKLRLISGEGCVDDYKMILATAAQRAEAFLRTIKKWNL